MKLLKPESVTFVLTTVLFNKFQQFVSYSYFMFTKNNKLKVINRVPIPVVVNGVITPLVSIVFYLNGNGILII